ncbi:MAG: thiamine pyrophosphate-dependent enzyme, partial [bacterium]|nr:thiamine pyrophosphate-dependent enzyme [bacterium]
VTGRPGVALVVPGPGVQNASAALGTAYAASSPVLLLAGQVESWNLGHDRGALHEINDQLDIIRPVTKWCQRVNQFSGIAASIHEAMRQMRDGRPRPTEVEIPPDLFSMEGEGIFDTPAHAAPTTPNWTDIQRAAERLRGAKKPLIWAGGGVTLADASRELLAFAEALGAPVATTPEGKGVMPEDHRLSLGTGFYGHGATTWAMQKADVILAVGTRLTGQMVGLNAPHAPQQLIHLDVDASVIDKNFPADIRLIGDARLGLQALLEEVTQESTPTPWSDDELTGIKQRQSQWLEHVAAEQSEIIRCMQRVLDDDAVLVSGVTNIGYWSHFAYCARHPRRYLTSSYFATLGFSFPLSLGAKVADPQRQVVALTGDGGFMYALPDLATAVQYNIGVVVVVFVDNALGASKNDQMTRYQGRLIGTDLHNPSFAEVARVFGARGIKCQPERLEQTLREALNATGPTVIEVPIPTRAPPFQVTPRSN